MGKLAKEHRKKVQARNKQIQDDKNRMQKLLKAAYLERNKTQNQNEEQNS